MSFKAWEKCLDEVYSVHVSFSKTSVLKLAGSTVGPELFKTLGEPEVRTSTS